MIKKPPVSARDIVITKPAAANDTDDKTAVPTTSATAVEPETSEGTPAIEAQATPKAEVTVDKMPVVPDETDEPDATVASQGVESSSASSGQVIPDSEIKVTQDLTLHVPLVQATNGQAVLVLPGSGNRRCFLVGSRQANNLLRQRARRKSHILTRRELADINDNLQAIAEMEGASGEVFSRVAPVPGGIETDLGDEKNTRVRITAGKVEIVAAGSPTLFYRPPISMPMVRPADRGNLGLLDQYLNLAPVDILLLKAWISYTLAHPKLATTKYPILLLQGEQGAGKSFLCSIVQALTDPNTVGV